MMKTRALRLLVAAGIMLAIGCSDSAVNENAMMKAGLDALYVRRDPYAAAAQFRTILEINPGHYGATYQLAAALDAAGRPDEATPV